ncbi:MAG: SsrA-binding protein SmpB [Chloroflexota bacterium]
MSNGIKIVSKNKKAFHDYEITDTYEAGLVLKGSEIKSIRGGRVNMRDGYVQEKGGELWLMGVHISLYEQATHFGHNDPLRPRKLLLHKKEIAQIMTWIRENTYTAVPTKLYLKNGRAKVEVGLAKGKKLYDKRQTKAKRDADRQIQRALKDRYNG